MIFRRAKILIYLFIGLFICYFTSDFALINIEKTALIVSIGVDKAAEKYSVTVQIAVPEATDGGSSNNESVITSDGKTLYEAVTNIGERTGWYPKLSFCNLIVMGESVLSENVMTVLDFFLRSYKVEDSSIICACEGNAKDLLLSHSPLDNISGMSLSKIFVRDSSGASKVLTNSLKDFSIGYFSRSGFSFMPKVKLVKTSGGEKVGKGGLEIENGGSGATGTAFIKNDGDENPESAIAAASAGEKKESKSESSDGGSGGGENTPVIYDASTAVAFDKGIYKGEITADEALCYSLTKKHSAEAYFGINSVSSEGKTGEVLIGIHKVKNEVSFRYVNDLPVLKIKLRLRLQITDADYSESIGTISKIGTLSGKMLKDCEKYFEFHLNSLMQKAKDCGFDVFELKTMLYRYANARYNSDKFTVSQNTSLETEIVCLNYI